MRINAKFHRNNYTHPGETWLPVSLSVSQSLSPSALPTHWQGVGREGTRGTQGGSVTGPGSERPTAAPPALPAPHRGVLSPPALSRPPSRLSGPGCGCRALAPPATPCHHPPCRNVPCPVAPSSQGPVATSPTAAQCPRPVATGPRRAAAPGLPPPVPALLPPFFTFSCISGSSIPPHRRRFRFRRRPLNPPRPETAALRPSPQTAPGGNTAPTRPFRLCLPPPPPAAPPPPGLSPPPSGAGPTPRTGLGDAPGDIPRVGSLRSRCSEPHRRGLRGGVKPPHRPFTHRCPPRAGVGVWTPRVGEDLGPLSPP